MWRYQSAQFWTVISFYGMENLKRESLFLKLADITNTSIEILYVADTIQKSKKFSNKTNKFFLGAN